MSTTRDRYGPSGVKGYLKFIVEHPKHPDFTRVAILLPEAAVPEYADTIDEVAKEDGVAMHAFSDEEEARKWLEIE